MNNSPLNPDGFLKPKAYFTSARNAFEFLLKHLEFTENDKILLPSYIGFTEREGSGVFDPVQNLNLNYIFYTVDKQLKLNITEVEKLLQSERIKVLLVIHYFGFCQNDIIEIKRLCKKQNVLLVEDCAHTMTSKVNGAYLGTFGDFAFNSIHKFLSTEIGGKLTINNNEYNYITNEKTNDLPDKKTFDLILRSDYSKIHQKRRDNYLYLENLLNGMPGFKFLYDNLPSGISPHNFPVVIDNNLREPLYFDLIKNEIPVIALYYRMIDIIKEKGFQDALLISNSILNLPVHQDITFSDLDKIADQFLISIINVSK